MSVESRIHVTRSKSTIAPSLRVALIGCGAISEQMHLPVLAGHPALKLTTLVDRDRARAKRLGQGYSVTQVFEDAADLSRDDVDAAIIATPPFHHAPCTLQLIEKGIHVLVEKPMATSAADAESMVAAAERASVVLAVGFFRRLYPSIRLMKGLLDTGHFGRPLSFHIEGGGMYGWAAATLGNMRRDLAGGGALIDFGSHMVDLMFALFDEPAEVIEYRDNSLGGIEADCTIELTATHNGQAIPGRVEIARTRMIGNFVRVECEQATLEFQVNERFRVKVLPRNGELVDFEKGQARGFAFEAGWQSDPADESWYATFARQYDDWLQAIQSGKEPVLSGRSALATSRFIAMCYQQPQPIRESWVQFGIPRSLDQGDSYSNGQPASGVSAVQNVHVAGGGGRILVTGANGFIGSRIVELLRLRDGRDVKALVHNPAHASRLARLDVEMVQGDLGAPAGVERLVKGCESILHCAIGTTWGESRKIVEVNVNGTRRLGEAALAAGVKRFVHVSTMAVYGDDSVLTGELDEETPVRPMHGSVYGESKAAAEHVVLKLAAQGLPAAIFRPARVFGPYSNIFISRPLQSIAERRFAWLGSPDVPCDMVYVDNVVDAMLAVLAAEPDAVAGQVFNIGDGDCSTWAEFYQFFAAELGLDLSCTPTEPPRHANGKSALRSTLDFPGGLVRGFGKVVTSREFKSLGRRVLLTDPIGTMPRRAIERFPAVEQGIRKIIKADDSLPVYQPESPSKGEIVHMGSGGSVLSIKKLRERIGYIPRVSRQNALQLTLDWVRDARIVQ